MTYHAECNVCRPLVFFLFFAITAPDTEQPRSHNGVLDHTEPFGQGHMGIPRAARQHFLPFQL